MSLIWQINAKEENCSQHNNKACKTRAELPVWAQPVTPAPHPPSLCVPAGSLPGYYLCSNKKPWRREAAPNIHTFWFTLHYTAALPKLRHLETKCNIIKHKWWFKEAALTACTHRCECSSSWHSICSWPPGRWSGPAGRTPELPGLPPVGWRWAHSRSNSVRVMDSDSRDEGVRHTEKVKGKLGKEKREWLTVSFLPMDLLWERERVMLKKDSFLLADGGGDEALTSLPREEWGGGEDVDWPRPPERLSILGEVLAVLELWPE